MTTASSPRLLRLPDVKEMTGLSHATIYRDPTFPKPVRIGERASAWVESEIRAWIEARIARRDAGETPALTQLDEARQKRRIAQRVEVAA